jgi:hypothetical protein
MFRFLQNIRKAENSLGLDWDKTLPQPTNDALTYDL